MITGVINVLNVLTRVFYTLKVFIEYNHFPKYFHLVSKISNLPT